MRLKERELKTAYLRRRIRGRDTLGGSPETFSGERIPFRASLLSDGGELKTAQHGLKSGAAFRLLADRGIAVCPGDGVELDEGFCVVRSVQKWIAHQEILCEARV